MFVKIREVCYIRRETNFSYTVGQVCLEYERMIHQGNRSDLTGNHLGITAEQVGRKFNVSGRTVSRYIRLDKNSKVFIVKIFATDANGEESIEEVLDSLIGKYVEFDVVSTKYGFQTQSITLKNIPVLQAPEVLVAEGILNTIIGQDSELMAYVKSYNLVENLKNTMRIDLGYELVYMAAELSLIESLENITDAYDFRAMKRAVFCMRGYLLQCKTRFSKSVRNFNKLSRTELRNDRELLLIIDPMAEEEVSLTKKAYYKVHKFAEELIDERRGLDDEAKKDCSTMFGSMRESFISML